MRRRIFIEIQGEIDGLSLWKLISKYKVNLTEVIDKSWVYGDVELHNIGDIIERCALYGPLKVEIGGVMYEQGEKEA